MVANKHGSRVRQRSEQREARKVLGREQAWRPYAAEVSIGKQASCVAVSKHCTRERQRIERGKAKRVRGYESKHGSRERQRS
ncbi:hypothetical protein PAT3040_06568 [Paenibacillus agaridevorans]|uniref:Uncharacterized protein n=1 Tax=Paenibacillus agaridevorans TaxID=171404 RepID=A0A2R5F4V0_9BACL|nr:hypothetical protein PAT3040_06568 [Paenibacillus agaridevorans]